MFTYNLQSILDFRQNTEEKKLTALAATEQHLRQEEHRLQDIRDQHKALIEALKALKDKQCDSREIALSMNFAEVLQKQEKRQTEVVRKAAALCDEKRRELLEAVKQRKMMEIHKEHRYQDYKAERTLSERRETDDLSIQRYIRRES